MISVDKVSTLSFMNTAALEGHWNRSFTEYARHWLGRFLKSSLIDSSVLLLRDLSVEIEAAMPISTLAILDIFQTAHCFWRSLSQDLRIRSYNDVFQNGDRITNEIQFQTLCRWVLKFLSSGINLILQFSIIPNLKICGLSQMQKS